MARPIFQLIRADQQYPRPEVGPAEDRERASLVRGLALGQAWAARAFLEEYTPRVRRVLVRVLGHDSELDDLTQEVFIRALDRVEQVSDPSGLDRWLTSIAIFVARESLRSRRRRLSWLFSLSDDGYRREGEKVVQHGELETVLQAFYHVLRKLGVDEQIVFALRHLDGMKLAELALSTQVSVATVKRRLAAAELRFSRLAAKHPLLSEWETASR